MAINNTIYYFLHSLSPVRRLRRYGHHIHSPSSYNLIREIVGSERLIYYHFEDLKSLLFENNIINRKGTKRGEIFFKLIQHLNCSKVLQIGLNSPIEPLYISPQYIRDNQLFIAEDREENYNIFETIYKKYNSETKIERVTTDDISNIYEAIFIDQASKNKLGLKEIIDSIISKQMENTVVIIYNSDNKRVDSKARKIIKNEKYIRVIFDMYDTIIILFNPELNRNRYSIYY